MRGNMKKTKIIASLGPSTSDYQVIFNMIDLGVDVFQIPYYSDGTIGTNKDAWGNINYVLKYDKLIKVEKYTPGEFSE